MQKNEKHQENKNTKHFETGRIFFFHFFFLVRKIVHKFGYNGKPSSIPPASTRIFYFFTIT